MLAIETNPTTGHTGQVQWVERGRLEEHVENQAPYDVSLARLGAERLSQLGRNWQAEERESGPKAGCLWFPETGHNVCDQEPRGGSASDRGFRSYWETEGLAVHALSSYARSLALHGLPITAARIETNASGQMILTQWFERGRFEWYPKNTPGSRTVAALLGSEVRAAIAQHGFHYFWPATLPPGLVIIGDQSAANETMFRLKVGQSGGGQFEATIQGGAGSEVEWRSDARSIIVRGQPATLYTTSSGTGIYWNEGGFPYAIVGRILPNDALSIVEGLEAWDLDTWQRRLPNTVMSTD